MLSCSIVATNQVIEMEATRYLIPYWMRRLNEDCTAEGQLNQRWKIKLLDMTTRRVIWNMCSKLEVACKGVPGQVCRITEMYLATRYYKKSLENVSKEEWDAFKLELTAGLPLFIAASIQLTAKTASMGERVRCSLVLKVLAERNIFCTLSENIHAEFNMFKTLDFRLPLWTSVEIVGLYCTHLELPGIVSRGAEIIVDIAEFNRYTIEPEIIAVTARCNEKFDKSSLRTVHLCVGSVISAMRYLRYDGQSPLDKLATYSNASAAYLSLVSDCIMKYLTNNTVTVTPLAIKRPRLLRTD